ncbi:putative aldouronate transport system permease protein [Lachnospiraceae bacterium NK3A20]|nr:putative aldouronate transport system permease protein [Lachnospiraceae bacterium NK3A20]
MGELKNSRSNKRFQIITGTIFIIITLIALVPILRVVSTSFSSKSAILSGKVTIFPADFTLDAYNKAFSNSNFTGSFLYTIVLTLVFTALAMFMTILAAYPLSKTKLKGAGFIMTAFVLTMYVDPGTIPTFMNIKSLNMIDTVWALLIPGCLSAYNLIIMRSFFLSIDKSLFEAAYIDGCSQFKTLTTIAIPLSKPTIATLALFYGVGRWNDVTDNLYYINTASLYTVQMQLKQMIDSVKISALEGTTTALVADNIKAASIVVSMVPMLIAYPFIQRYFTSGIMLGAVKG